MLVFFNTDIAIFNAYNRIPCAESAGNCADGVPTVPVELPLGENHPHADHLQNHARVG